MELDLYTIDAFATGPFTGNPAAVCPLKEWLSDELMQAIAAQNNLAETAFVVRIDEARYHIRWFTPATEVPLCGHATLATAFALKNELGETSEKVCFDSQSGLLFVSNTADQFTLDFPIDTPERIDTPTAIATALGANPSECWKASYYLFIFNSQEIVQAIEPDLRALGAIPNTFVIVSAPGDDCDFVSRFFAPSAGIDEDPVTGSAHCMLTPYWAKRLSKRSLLAKQISPRGGDLVCEALDDRVLISGKARLYSKAKIFV